MIRKFIVRYGSNWTANNPFYKQCNYLGISYKACSENEFHIEECFEDVDHYLKIARCAITGTDVLYEKFKEKLEYLDDSGQHYDIAFIKYVDEETIRNYDLSEYSRPLLFSMWLCLDTQASVLLKMRF